MRTRPPRLETNDDLVYEIKDRLREILRIRGTKLIDGETSLIAPNSIHAERGDGKTEALIQFVGERILQIRPDMKIAVVTPSSEISRMFKQRFDDYFPAMRKRPIIVTLTDPFSVRELAGQRIAEVYAEEMFLIKPRYIHEVSQMFPFIAGLGTLRGPVLLNIQNW